MELLFCCSVKFYICIEFKRTEILQDPDVSKRDLFDVLVQWRDSVTEDLKSVQYTDQLEVDEIIAKWQLETRLKGRQLNVPKGNVY